MNTHTELLSCWYICCPISHHTPKWWCITFLDCRIRSPLILINSFWILGYKYLAFLGELWRWGLRSALYLLRKSNKLVKFPSSLLLPLSQLLPLKPNPCFKRNWMLSMINRSAFVFNWTCLTYASLSYLIGCLFFSMTAIKLTACSTHCLWDWDWEWRFSVPWTVPTAFFQLRKGEATHSLLNRTWLNRQHGPQKTPCSDAEYRAEGNCSVQYDW